MIEKMTRFEKMRVSLRFFLLGAKYYRAAEALEVAQIFHDGYRKDGVTPEFQHQIAIAHYIRTLIPFLIYPEETLTAALFHDTKEDYGVMISTIQGIGGNIAADAVDLLDKNGKEPDHYFANIAINPIASIVKGADRSNNIQTMEGVFSTEKQTRYVNEVDEYFLPMLKTARRKFPIQEAAYHNIKHMLVSQTELIRHKLNVVACTCSKGLVSPDVSVTIKA